MSKAKFGSWNFKFFHVLEYMIFVKDGMVCLFFAHLIIQSSCIVSSNIKDIFWPIFADNEVYFALFGKHIISFLIYLNYMKNT